MLVVTWKIDKDECIRKVGALVIKLRLTPEVDIKDFLAGKKKPLYTSVALTETGEKVMFRVALNKYYNQMVQKEIRIYMTARNHGSKFFPELTQNGTTSGLNWLTYNYIPGRTRGNVYQFDKGTNYDLIIQFLREMPEVTHEIPRDLFPPALDRKDWTRSLYETIATQPEIANLDFVKFALNKIESNLSKISLTTIVHGDFHAKNILFAGDNLRVIDWESSKLNSSAYDLSYLWIRCHDDLARKKIWQELVGTNSSFEAEARVILATLLIKEFCEWRQIKENKNDYLKPSDILNGASADDMLESLAVLITNLSKQI